MEISWSGPIGRVDKMGSKIGVQKTGGRRFCLDFEKSLFSKGPIFLSTKISIQNLQNLGSKIPKSGSKIQKIVKNREKSQKIVKNRQKIGKFQPGNRDLADMADFTSQGSTPEMTHFSKKTTFSQQKHEFWTKKPKN